MKKKIRRIIGIAIILLIAVAAGIRAGRNLYDNSHVKFADKTMGTIICKTTRRNNITLEEVTHKDLNKIRELNIGFSGYYKTLKDIRYCKSVEDLSINWGIGDYDPVFSINQGKADRELSKAEIEETQKELGSILPKLSHLKILWLSDMGGCNWTSLEFLKDCNQIEELQISRCNVENYSVLKNCTSLKHLSLSDSKISKAEDIIGLEHLKFISFFDTPLAENPEEIKQLQEAYPDAEIRWKRKE